MASWRRMEGAGCAPEEGMKHAPSGAAPGGGVLKREGEGVRTARAPPPRRARRVRRRRKKTSREVGGENCRGSVGMSRHRFGAWTESGDPRR